MAVMGARTRGLLANIADAPGECAFIVPAATVPDAVNLDAATVAWTTKA